MAASNIITVDFFVRKGKIRINGQAASMICRPAPFVGRRRSGVVYDRNQSCAANQVNIRVLIHYGNKVLLYILDVAQDDIAYFLAEFRHHPVHHGCCKFLLGFLFLPHAVSNRDGKVRNFLSVLDRDIEHDADKAVAVQIIGTVIRRMVKKN